MQQMQRKTAHLRKSLKSAFTLPFQSKQVAVAPLQRLRERITLSPDQTPDLQKILLHKRCAVHGPPPLHQIMRLIHQKQIFSFYILSEKPFQTDIRIKDIIIIADQHIDPQCQIQIQFEGTDPVFVSLLKKHLSGQRIRSAGPQVIDRFVNAVKMPFCIRTVIGIAFRLFTNAQLFLCSQYNGFYMKSLFPQKLQRILCHRSGNCPGGKVENLVADPLSHRFQGRKQYRQCFADSGGRLNKKPLFAQKGSVHTYNQFSLSGPVFIRKGKFLKGLSALFFPLIRKVHPLLILFHQTGKPF